MHNYHDSVGSLPDGHFGTGWHDWGAAVMLLPFMEQSPLYSSINFADNGNSANPGSSGRRLERRESAQLHDLPDEDQRPALPVRHSTG